MWLFGWGVSFFRFLFLLGVCRGFSCFLFWFVGFGVRCSCRLGFLRRSFAVFFPVFFGACRRLLFPVFPGCFSLFGGVGGACRRVLCCPPCRFRLVCLRSGCRFLGGVLWLACRFLLSVSAVPVVWRVPPFLLPGVLRLACRLAASPSRSAVRRVPILPSDPLVLRRSFCRLPPGVSGPGAPLSPVVLRRSSLLFLPVPRLSVLSRLRVRLSFRRLRPRLGVSAAAVPVLGRLSPLLRVSVCRFSSFGAAPARSRLRRGAVLGLGLLSPPVSLPALFGSSLLRLFFDCFRLPFPSCFRGDIDTDPFFSPLPPAGGCGLPVSCHPVCCPDPLLACSTAFSASVVPIRYVSTIPAGALTPPLPPRGGGTHWHKNIFYFNLFFIDNSIAS